MKRTVTTAALIVSALLPALQTGLATPASAQVVAVSLPTGACISARTVTLSGTVRVSWTGNGMRSASLWFSYPGADAATQVGTATSRRPGLLAITARIDASRIVPGPNLLQVVDAADGDRKTINLDLRRQSQVSITQAELRPHGQVALAVHVTHYDPKLNTLMASRLSPVQLQEQVAGKWVALATVTTDTQGLASALLPASSGPHAYRAFRPDGVTVLAATSGIVSLPALVSLA